MKREEANIKEVNMKKEKLYELMFGCVGTMCIPFVADMTANGYPLVEYVEKARGEKKARVFVKNRELVVSMN
jgi:hypothetical protein